MITKTLADITTGDRVQHDGAEHYVFGVHRLTTPGHVHVDLSVDRISDGSECVISGPGNQPIAVRAA